jgi:hypothetical protein
MAAAGEATTTEELIAQLRAGAGLGSADPNGTADSPSAIDVAEDATVTDIPAAVSGSDLGAARLVAMNMALEGSSREEISSQLKSEFGEVDGVEGLLDDVLSRAGR